MIETANILHTATPDSLILLDEIGRGTSTFDGLSLAWSIIEYIQKYKHTLTLFATHYHELTELENIYPDIRNYNVLVKEYNDQMIFLRKIERGGADQSYGIQVARLAGIPDRVIRRAREILKGLCSAVARSNDDMEIAIAQLRRECGLPPAEDSHASLRAFDTPVQTGIKAIDALTPIEAWQKLKELQDML